MTDDNARRLTRRTALQGIAGAVGAATIGGVAFLASGPAAAAMQEYGSATVTSDDGTINHVSIYGDSTVSWEGFENAADSVTIEVQARCLDADAGWRTLYTTTADLTDDSWGGSGESHTGVGTSGELSQDIGLDEDGEHDAESDWAIVQADGYEDAYGIPSNESALSASGFEVDGDGDSATYAVEMRSHYTWHDGESEEFTETFPATVEVDLTNRPKDSESTDGDGESGAVAG